MEKKSPKKPSSKQLLRKAEEIRLQGRRQLFDPANLNFDELIHEFNACRKELRDLDQKLKKSKIDLIDFQNKYFETFELAPIGYFSLDQNGVIEEVNVTGAGLLESAKPELIQRRFSDFVHRDSIQEYRIFLKALSENHKGAGCELKLVKGESDFFVGYIRGKKSRRQNSSYSKIRLALLDISKRKRTEQLLEASEKKYRTLVDNIATGITLISPDMRILSLNPRMKIWFPEIDLSQNPFCFKAFHTPSKKKPCRNCPVVKTFQDGTVHEFTIRTSLKTGTKHFRIVASPLYDNSGKIEAVIEMVEDVTETVNSQERIRSLTNELINAQETERRLISCELHDTVAQELAFVKMHLKLFQKECGCDSMEVADKIVRAEKSLKSCISHVRNIAYNLRPSILDVFGISKAIGDLCDRFSCNSGIQVDYDCKAIDDRKLGPQMESHLYRIVQEALNNIRKHSGAKKASVQMVKNFADLDLIIEDDGKGFDPEYAGVSSASGQGMGLTGMKYRVELLFGKMETLSKPGAGVKISVKIPVNETKENEESGSPSFE